MRLKSLLVSAVTLGEKGCSRQGSGKTLHSETLKPVLRLLHSSSNEAPVLNCFKRFFPSSTKTFGKLDNFMDILVWSRKLNFRKNTFLKNGNLATRHVFDKCQLLHDIQGKDCCHLGVLGWCLQGGHDDPPPTHAPQRGPLPHCLWV